MSGGFCISDYVESMANDVFTNGEVIFAKTPKEFKTLVDYYVKNPLERFQHIQAGYQSVVKNHTYFDRMATVFSALGLESEAKRCIEVKGSFFEEGL